MLDYSIAAVVAAAYFVLQLQDRAEPCEKYPPPAPSELSSTPRNSRGRVRPLPVLHRGFAAACQAGLSDSGGSATVAAPVCGQAAAAPALFAEAGLC